MKSKTYVSRISINSMDKQDGPKQSYEQYCEMSAVDEDGESIESPRANPDVLPEGTSYFGDAQPTRAQLLMGEAVEHLQGQQKAVYKLTMREDYSIAQAAAKLGISKSTAQVYRERALKFIQQYCARHTTW